jgi:hypothetical protein
MTISSAMSFEDAISATQSLLERREQTAIEDTEVEATVAELVATHNGARGFFVVYLTDSREFVETLNPIVASGLRNALEFTPALLVKNLAMSTVMEHIHRRDQNPDQAAQSAQVQRRTLALMKLLGFSYVKADVEGLWQALMTDTGTYAGFLKQRGYDAEHKAAIAQYLSTVYPEVMALKP